MATEDTGDGIEYTRRDRYGAASEFGGVSGLIQPYPHEPTPAEARMMMMGDDPDGTNMPKYGILPESKQVR